MSQNKLAFIVLLLHIICLSGVAQHLAAGHDTLPRLNNPMTVSYLKKNLRKTSPRLVLTPAIEKELRNKIRKDTMVANVYQAIKLNATEIMKEPLLEYQVVGRRLLATSREMLYRMNILGMVYRIEKSSDVAERIDQEIQAVCGFKDWNPSHYLDVAEMSMAVAIGIDWAGEALPPSTVSLAKKALIGKGILPGFETAEPPGWVNGTNNWNQVCHGGMIAAAIMIADINPELASRTISRALDGIPYALAAYLPDGVYPEGSTYWTYGTAFTVLTSSMLQSSLGTDFGLSDYSGLLESATFKLLSVAPSGDYYNFADCGDSRSEQGDMVLAWFAKQTGNSLYLERSRFSMPPQEMGKLSRWAGAGLAWISAFEVNKSSMLPPAWKGDGENPVVIFRGGDDDPHQFYFGGKGGRGSVNHGNMDAGSFILEMNGVRWVVDPGNQEYHELEKTGFDLWGRCQACERWTLLTKNNYGHSTLTVNDELHVVDGFAPITKFTSGTQPTATVDLSAVFQGQLLRASRTFTKENNQSLMVEDMVELTDQTRMVQWQLITTAAVTPTGKGALLQQEGKQLTLEIIEPKQVQVSVISLDPPPLKLDRKIDGLKRIEIRVPAYFFEEGKGAIIVRLSGEDQ